MFFLCLNIVLLTEEGTHLNCFICKKEDLDNHIKTDYSKQKFTKANWNNSNFEEDNIDNIDP